MNRQIFIQSPHHRASPYAAFAGVAPYEAASRKSALNRVLRWAFCISLVSALALSGCKSKQPAEDAQGPDLASTHTSAAAQSGAGNLDSATGGDLAASHAYAATTEAPGQASGTAAQVTGTPALSLDDTPGNTAASSAAAAGQTVANVSAGFETYTAGDVSIEYPIVSNLPDKAIQNAVNDLLRSNALSVLESDGIDPDADTVSVKCKVTAVDRRRITAVYTGSYIDASGSQGMNPGTKIRLFFTNTVDLQEARSLSLSDYADPTAMAGYVMSDACEFQQVTGAAAEKLRAYKSTNDMAYYVELLTGADFSSSPDFPRSFSYESQGSLYFSIPVSHELGDYALVGYQMDAIK
jgi:hypothetical protein